jgi:hypothetical protein
MDRVKEADMTNRLAIILLVLIAGVLALDHYVWHVDILPFIFRKLLLLIDKMSFWR